MSTRDPLPEPRGSLRPPVRHPPTAVGIATPPPSPEPMGVGLARRREPALIRFLRRLACVPLDLADALVDTVRIGRT